MAELSIGSWSLLESKFYQAWSSGELPVSALRVYAKEYGEFIRLLPLGWEAQDDQETAHEEEEHAELWEVFANALDTEIGSSQTPEVRTLVESARSLFGKRATAIGALFAFEVQQPETAQSKLEGLRKHYALGKEVEPYFEIHCANHHEAEKLRERFRALSETEQLEACAACETMAKHLRQALDGIYRSECPMMK